MCFFILTHALETFAARAFISLRHVTMSQELKKKCNLNIYLGGYRNAIDLKDIQHIPSLATKWHFKKLWFNAKECIFSRQKLKLRLNVHVYNMHMRLLLRLYYMNLGPYGPLSFMLSGFSQLFCTGMCLWLGDPKNSSVVGYLQTPRPFGLGLAKKS